MEFDLKSQPEIVQTIAGYAVQFYELALTWLLSPAAWSQFGLLILACFAPVMAARSLQPMLAPLLDPGENDSIIAQARQFVVQFVALLLPLLANAFTGIGESELHTRSSA